MPSDRFLSLPFEQQIGQFFFIGLPGKTIDSEARELIEEIKPGGIILFGRNVDSPDQVRKLLDDARALVPTQLLPLLQGGEQLVAVHMPPWHAVPAGQEPFGGLH